MKSTYIFTKKLFIGLITLLMLVTLIPQQTGAHNPYNPEYDYGVGFWNDDTPDVGFYINAAANYTVLEYDEPNFGTYAGEWSVMNLLRGMYTGADYINQIPNNYFDTYLKNVEDFVIREDGKLDRNKSTEWSRTILAMNAMNQDITDIGGYDFIEKLSESHVFNQRQGINGPIWTLIALNSGRDKLYTPEEYTEKTGKEADLSVFNTEGKMIDFILGKEITHKKTGIVGGWALGGSTPDTDINGMALQGLAPYYLNQEMFEAVGSNTSYEEFAKAVERGVVALKVMQLPDGSYPASGYAGTSTNAESTAQAVVGLTELGIDPLTEGHHLPHIEQTVSFKTQGNFQDGVFTNNMIDALLTFWADNSYKTKSKTDNEYYAVGGFKHIKSGDNDGGGGAGTTVNGMATDQALYGLIAYDRFISGDNKLYDMQDMITDHGGQSYDVIEPTEYNFNIYLNENKKKLEKNVPQSVSPYQVIELPNVKDDAKKLAGWTNRTDGKGKLFEPGTLLSIPNLNGKGNELNLYAVYDLDEFNLTLNSDGGTYDEAKFPSSITVDDTVNLPTKDEITKKGYKFIGWYENKDFTSDRQTELKKTMGDVELYAKWSQLDVDKQELEKALNAAEKVSIKGMTGDSVTEFNRTIEEAKALNNKEETTQEAIDKMTDKVNQAEEKLVVDKSELKEKIKEGKKVLE